MFKWLKRILGKKEQPVQSENVKKSEVFVITPPKYRTPVTKCKLHFEYNGLATPTNNCNVCWQMHSEAMKR